MPVEEEDHGESVPQPQLKIPAKLSTAFPTFGVMPKCCFFLPSVREMVSDNSQDFASEEDTTVTQKMEMKKEEQDRQEKKTMIKSM